MPDVLSKVVGGVIVADTTAEIAANIDALETNIADISNIVITDGSASVLMLTAEQENTDVDVLNKIAGTYELSTTVDDTSPPSVAFDSQALINGVALTLTGTASDNRGLPAVEIFNGADNLGTAKVNTNGTWILSTELAPGSYEALTAVAIDAAGNYTFVTAPFKLVSDSSGILTSSALTSTVTSSYDASGDLIQQQTAQTNGNLVTDRYDESGTLIGFTSIQNGVREEQQLVIADKPYTGQNAFYDSANALISMTRTYADGSPAFSQVTNLDGSQTVKSWTPAGAEQIATFAANGAVTEVDSFDAAGHQIGTQTQTSDGSRVTSVYDPTTKALISQTTRHPDKSVTYENLAIAGKPYTEQTATYDAAGHLLQMQRNYGDAAHTLAFSQVNNSDGSNEVDQYDTSGRQTLKILGAATAGDDTFVFQPVFGQDVIQGFHAGAGAHHDTLQFDSALVPDFLNLRSLMSAQGHDTLITISPSDTLLLKGVAPTALVAQDFTFIPHAGHNA